MAVYGGTPNRYQTGDLNYFLFIYLHLHQQKVQ